MTVIVEPVTSLETAAPAPAQPAPVDPRLYGDVSDKPAQAEAKAPASENAPLNLSVPQMPAPQTYPSFGTKGTHGALTGAFTPHAAAARITFEAQSPTSAGRVPTPLETTLPRDKQGPGTLNLNHRPAIQTGPSFADQSEARITAATTERLPPRPQDGMPGPTRPQRASAGRVAIAELREQFNPAAAHISLGPPNNRPQGPSQGRTEWRVSLGSGRVGASVGMTF